MRLPSYTLFLLGKSFLLIWLFSTVFLGAYAGEPNAKKQLPATAKVESSTTHTPNSQLASPPPLQAQPNSTPDIDHVEISNPHLIEVIIYLTGFGLFISFCWGIYVIKDRSEQFEPYLGGGLLLQTIVVVMIVQCVLALALSGILKATEVGTIYGGIIGYIFGRRVSSKDTQGTSSNGDS